MGASFSNHDIHPTLACDPTEVRIPSYHSSLNGLTPDQDGNGTTDAGTKEEEENPGEEEEEGGSGGSGGVREGMLGLMMIGL